MTHSWTCLIMIQGVAFALIKMAKITNKTITDFVRTIEDRSKQYGPPEEFFKELAPIWSAMLGKELSTYEVANLFIAFKALRFAKNPKKYDTIKDLINYALISYSLWSDDCDDKNMTDD